MPRRHPPHVIRHVNIIDFHPSFTLETEVRLQTMPGLGLRLANDIEHKPQPTAYRSIPRLAATVLLGLMLITVTGCNFGREAPTPEAFTPPTYEPGFATTPSPAEDTSAGVAAPDAALPDPNTQPVPSSNTTAGNGSPWVYTGEIEPEEEIAVVAEVGGQVLEADMQVGDRVSAGQALIRVDSAVLEAQRAQALAGLEATQAQLELLLVDPEDEDIEAARGRGCRRRCCLQTRRRRSDARRPDRRRIAVTPG